MKVQYVLSQKEFENLVPQSTFSTLLCALIDMYHKSFSEEGTPCENTLASDGLKYRHYFGYRCDNCPVWRDTMHSGIRMGKDTCLLGGTFKLSK